MAAQFGLGSFSARLAAGGPIGNRPVRVEVDWRDEPAGEWGTSVITITSKAGAERAASGGQ